MNTVGIYIHIPFCNSICSYCDFCKFLYKKEWAVLYLKALKREIEERYMQEEVRTIYIGGGTPSSLSLKEIEYVLALCNNFNIKKLEEFTFECNIEDINRDLLILLKKYKVNRLSIGIESFDSDNLKFMNRNCNYEEVSEKMKLARELGFNNINLDLIYALPKESLNTLKKDIKYLISLNPEHISTYSLIIEDNTYLSYKKTKAIDDKLDRDMYDYICKKIEKYGYNHYEVSNFAKAGLESKHNLTYWNNQEYYGFGCGASGYISGVRYDNTRNLSNYIKGSYNGTNSLLSKEDIMEYELILGLRKLEGINTLDFYNKYNVNIEEVFPIKPLIDNHELVYSGDYLRINREYIYVMNEILVKLV